MNNAQGTIVNSSSFNYQGTDLYSFQLQGDKKYYRTGDVKTSFNDGDCIEFSYNVKGRNNNVDRKTMKYSTAAPAAAAPAPRAAAASGGGSQKDTYWADKEAYQKEVVEPRIGFQASRAQAVQLVCAALAHDALSLGATKGKKLDSILDYVDQVTDRFFLAAQHAAEHIKTLEATALEVGKVVDVDAADYGDDS